MHQFLAKNLMVNCAESFFEINKNWLQLTKIKSVVPVIGILKNMHNSQIKLQMNKQIDSLETDYCLPHHGTPEKLRVFQRALKLHVRLIWGNSWTHQ